MIFFQNWVQFQTVCLFVCLSSFLLSFSFCLSISLSFSVCLCLSLPVSICLFRLSFTHTLPINLFSITPTFKGNFVSLLTLYCLFVFIYTFFVISFCFCSCYTFFRNLFHLVSLSPLVFISFEWARQRSDWDFSKIVIRNNKTCLGRFQDCGRGKGKNM